MKTYPIPMVPGPVKAHPAVLEAYRVDYGSADLEKEYIELYTQTEANLNASSGPAAAWSSSSGKA